MVQTSDKYCDDLFDYVCSCQKPVRVADLGVAFGYTSRVMLQCGADVTINDLSESHLNISCNSVSKEE